MRLNARQWVIAIIVLTFIILLTPHLWKKVERFKIDPDYRIPYALSKDYWLFERRLEKIADPNQIIVLGDSVVWGEYVLPNGTLSHFLNEAAGSTNRFINGGVNGLFPLALEGLVRYYGDTLRDRKIILHCNLLWMSSPKADLQIPQEETFNHQQLVPQFRPRVPCYKASVAERLNIVVDREVRFLGWVDHLQSAYFDGKSILNWTLADDAGDPPHYPNTYKNPFAQITFEVPTTPASDPLRGPQSPRHKAWDARGPAVQSFEWVDLNTSLQWGAFQRLVQQLLNHHNQLLIILGPFNEHMIAPDNLAAYQALCDAVADWLAKNKVTHLVPKVLPSGLYADASHPLTQGYERLSKEIYREEVFQAWLKSSRETAASRH